MNKHVHKGAIMRSYIAISILSLAALACSTAPAAAQAATCDPSTALCIGQPCSASEVGTSKLDHDQTKVIVCLYSDAAHTSTSWKSMSPAAEDQTCPAFALPTTLSMWGRVQNTSRIQIPSALNGQTVSARQSVRVRWNGTVDVTETVSATCIAGTSAIQMTADTATPEVCNVDIVLQYNSIYDGSDFKIPVTFVKRVNTCTPGDSH